MQNLTKQSGAQVDNLSTDLLPQNLHDAISAYVLHFLGIYPSYLMHCVTSEFLEWETIY